MRPNRVHGSRVQVPIPVLEFCINYQWLGSACRDQPNGRFEFDAYRLPTQAASQRIAIEA
jgi:hypothetical protein